MARGTVVTARGRALNMEELIMAAKRPMSMQGVDQKNKVEPKKPPMKQLNVRGFVPSASGLAPPVQHKTEVVEPIVEEDEGPTMAELTAVTLNGAKRIKERPEDPSQVANETLRDIMTDLEQFKTRDTTIAQDEKKKARKAS